MPILIIKTRARNEMRIAYPSVEQAKFNFNIIRVAMADDAPGYIIENKRGQYAGLTSEIDCVIWEDGICPEYMVRETAETILGGMKAQHLAQSRAKKEIIVEAPGSILS
jgi:hypothetical protein